MEKPNVFRQESLKRIQSPEQLNDYLRVTNPAVWALLTSVVIFLAGMLVWCSFTYIGSFADGTATVEKGVMTIRFEDDNLAKNVEAGMTVNAGDVKTTISSVGYNTEGHPIAMAESNLSDGTYQVRVGYKETQILKLLFK